MSRGIVIAAFAAAHFTGVVAAVAADASVEEVVVVATRSPQEIDKIGASVTVLDTGAIEASQATTMSELLATTPGITFTRSGGPGNVTNVFIRGADADHTLVLIDGVVLNDPAAVNGALDFGNLLVGDTARVEILRGAQSTLYGSQAIGGVINIVTAGPHDGFGGDLQAEYGSLGTSLTRAGIGGKYDDWSFRLAGTHYSSDSVPDLDPRFGGTTTDPFHESIVSGRATYDFAPTVQLDLRAYWTDGRNYYDGFPPPDYVLANDTQYQTTHQFVDYSGLNFDLFGGHLKNRVAWQYTTTQRADFDNSGTPITQTDSYRGNNSRAEYQGTWDIAPGYQAVFGLQQEKSWVDTTPYAPAHADTAQNSEYVQVVGEVGGGLTLTAGERHDHYDSFGQHYTGQLAAAWVLPSATILRASLSQGYKAPSLYQLYSPYGNPVLAPEKSAGGDAGVEQRLLGGRLTLSATYFLTHFQNLIVFESCPGSPQCDTLGQAGGYYANLNRARAAGVELQASAALTQSLAVHANYSHVATVDETPGSLNYGQQAYERPRDAANLAVVYTWGGGLALSAAARFSGFSRDLDFGVYPVATVHLGGYTLLNLHASYPLGSKLELYARIDNATNKYYETIYQYATWGRTGAFGVRAKF
jgi:vitamin B12 transporter